MNDHRELKRLAEAALNDNGDYVALNDYGMAVPPAVVLDLIAEVEGLRSGWYSDECDNLRFWPEELSESKQEVDRLEAEVEALRKDRTDWQAECLKRGFEYVRESDDHYVLADIPEMAELLGLLLGVEVRSKDNDSYGETVSMLQDMADANSDAFHRAYELEKENESLKKDAARFRFIEQDASSGMSNIYGDEWVSVIDSIINEDNNK